MSEHYLSQPIGEYLLQHHSGPLDSEVDHPNLNLAGRRGRPRQIDFCLSSKDKNRLTTAFELKWVGEGPFDKQRVVDDMLRLEALRNAESQHVYRYFLVAGDETSFACNFQNSQANLGSGGGRVDFFSEFLDFVNSHDKTVDVTSLSAPQREACDEFSSYYQSPCPRRFVTQRVYGTTMSGFSVYIWRIRSTKHRTTLPQAPTQP
ncbi:hypothetical protein JYB87_00870 [Shewanella avicenniae]|uniref:PD-(D/E)XK nuclease superfamily protein n=1 Tax=Shewanella avicenniae TaxID=2814294 RepID=A0ABX7QQU7_9GAMM|nr:hypothetical protein [Shewanella avicenniae]QSX33839.1 hypothetical protein JYB87_00870 [Shewanella avicenniae]